MTDPAPLPDHLSVSAVQLYRRCPAQWRRRYLDGIENPPSPAMSFGKAFALALEAHHLGADGDVMFARAHAASGIAVPGAEYGLRLLELYRQRFNLDGQPEQPFSLYLPARHRLPVPIQGVMDLERTDEVVEFKTSRNRWSQARADAEYQSAVYGWAFEQRHGRPPGHVRYLVFSTRTIGVQEIMTRPSASDFQQFELAASVVWRGIVGGAFDGCGRCELCRASEAREETTYDWWPPSPGVTAVSTPADLPLAPSRHHAFWSRPGWPR
jgi:hypothetical protein